MTEKNKVRKRAYTVEVCCGSFYDAKQAALGGADRIELNSALALGGLTPTIATLQLVKQQLPSLKVIAMVRPRGAGFCYQEEEFQTMVEECQTLLEGGADGIAFGCLKEDASLDEERSKHLLTMIKERGKEAVFHRAFDCSPDPFVMLEKLIALGVDRVLTSGQKPTAIKGVELIERLQSEYGEQIELLAGSGVNALNACELLKRTGIHQLHSSCKTWQTDPTTVQNGVSYSISPGEHVCQYDVVSARAVQELVEAVQNFT